MMVLLAVAVVIHALNRQMTAVAAHHTLLDSFCISNTSAAAAADDDDDEAAAAAAGRRCFSLWKADTAINRDNASQSCEARGSRLGVLSDAQSHEAILSRFRDLEDAEFQGVQFPDAWVALRRARDDKWRWLNGEEAAVQDLADLQASYQAGFDCAYGLYNQTKIPDPVQLVSDHCFRNHLAVCLEKNNDCGEFSSPADVDYETSTSCLYTVTNADLSWAGQRGLCNQDNADLVAITDGGDVNKHAIAQVLQQLGSHPAWLGLIKNPWQWVLPGGETQMLGPSYMYHLMIDSRKTCGYQSLATDGKVQFMAADCDAELPLYICETVTSEFATTSSPPTLTTSKTSGIHSAPHGDDPPTLAAGGSTELPNAITSSPPNSAGVPFAKVTTSKTADISSSPQGDIPPSMYAGGTTGHTVVTKELLNAATSSPAGTPGVPSAKVTRSPSPGVHSTSHSDDRPTVAAGGNTGRTTVLMTSASTTKGQLPQQITETEDADTNSGSLSIGTIIIIALISVVIVMIVSTILIVLVRKWKKCQTPEDTDTIYGNSLSNVSTGTMLQN